MRLHRVVFILAMAWGAPVFAQTVEEDLLKRNREDRYYVQTHMDLGEREFKREHYATAAEHFRKAAQHADRLNPAEYAPWEGLGEALERAGDTTGAAAAYREALERVGAAGENQDPIRARIEGKLSRVGGAAPPKAAAEPEPPASPVLVLQWISAGERILNILRLHDSGRPAPDARSARELFEKAKGRLAGMQGTPEADAVKGGIPAALARCEKGMAEARGFEIVGSR